ncbi:MAG: Na+/H+ antiporter subunit C [Opitutales bacterium]
MNSLIAILVGVMTAGSLYCLLRRSLVRLVFGLVLLSQTVNLIVFSAGGLSPPEAPVIAEGQKELQGTYADPLPQALVLTAIVIGFGLIAFTLALTHRAYEELGDDDIDHFRRTDQ